MAFVATSLTPADQAKVPTPGYTPLTWDELATAVALPVGERPRLYGYLEDGNGGQIVTIRSQYDLERFDNLISFAWMSGTTIADLIRRA